jgi:hypothetical protein
LNLQSRSGIKPERKKTTPPNTSQHLSSSKIMSTNIVLLPLSNWTESHITAIYSATTQPETSNALDNFLEKNAVLTVNGKTISRSDLTKELQSEKFLEIGASVTFNNIVEVPADKSAPVLVIYLYFHSNFE